MSIERQYNCSMKEKFKSSNSEVANMNKKRYNSGETSHAAPASSPLQNNAGTKRVILKRSVTWKNIERSSNKESICHTDCENCDESLSSSTECCDVLPSNNNESLNEEIKEESADRSTKENCEKISHDFDVQNINNESSIGIKEQAQNEKADANPNEHNEFSLLTIPNAQDPNILPDYDGSSDKIRDTSEKTERDTANLEDSDDELFVPLLFDNILSLEKQSFDEIDVGFTEENISPRELPSNPKSCDDECISLISEGCLCDGICSDISACSNNSNPISYNVSYCDSHENNNVADPSALRTSDISENSKLKMKVGSENSNDKESNSSEMCNGKYDSDDEDDTWYPKNIKERIKNILDSKLKVHRYKVETDSEARIDIKNSKNLRTNDDVDEKRTETYLPLERNGIKNKRSDVNFKSLASVPMNLTFFTDSDENSESPQLSPSNHSYNEDESIIDKWKLLEVNVRKNQSHSAQFHQLHQQLKLLKTTLENILNHSVFSVDNVFENFSQISTSLEKIKSLTSECENLKTEISGLNTKVHLFSSEIGSSFAPLKDEMTELYRIWDETYQRVTSKLTHIEQIEAVYSAWEKQKMELNNVLNQDSDALKVVDTAVDNGKLTESVTASVRDIANLLNEGKKFPCAIQPRNQYSSKEASENLHDIKKKSHLSDSGTSGYESCSSDDLSERERRLAYLKRLAKELEVSLLPECHAWKEINATLHQAEKKLKELQDHCRYLIRKTAETFEPSTKNLHVSSNSKRRILAREGKCSRNSRREKRTKIVATRPDWMWRVARAAVPFQITLMLLVCVACLLEPNCCDSVNTFNLSFTPQLRYVHGSPPV